MRQGRVKGKPRAAAGADSTKVEAGGSTPVAAGQAYRRTRADEAEGRPSYRASDGQLCWSVTQIIGRAADPEPLLAWAHWLGSRRISLREGRASARIGTAVHLVVQALAEGREPPATALDGLAGEDYDQAVHAIEAFKAWWPTAGLRLLRSEVQLIHDGLRLGGSVDFLAEDMATGEAVAVVGDWKTSRAIYPEMFAQLAAYRLMLRDGRTNDGKPCPLMGTSINRGLLVRLPKKEAPIAEVHWLTAADLDLGLRQFMGAYEVVMARFAITASLDAARKAARAAAKE